MRVFLLVISLALPAALAAVEVPWRTPAPPVEVAERERAKAAAGSEPMVILAAASPAVPVPPPAAPTTGAKVTSVAVSAATVPRFTRLELTVALDRPVARPYDADPARGGIDLHADLVSPSGAPWRVNGFWDGAAWRIRFAADEAGEWTGTVTALSNDLASSATAAFTCAGEPASVARRGWVRVAGGGLRTSGDSRWLAGIGHNTGWQPAIEVPALTTMAANGMNLLTFWMAEPWARVSDDVQLVGELVLPSRAPLENAQQGLGAYNQAACLYLDQVVQRAEAAGVWLVPSLWAHDEVRDAFSPWGAASWDNNAYQAVCADSRDFFRTRSGGVDTENWRWQRNRYRYIAARWGYSTAIAGWVGLVEIDGTAGVRADTSAAAREWCVRVRDEMAAADPFHRSVEGGITRYPYCVTKTDSVSADAATDWAGLDVLACDSYRSERDNVAVAATIADETASMRATGRPAYHTEFGGRIQKGSAASQPAHLTNGLWAGLASGASLSPLLWTDGGAFPLVQTSTSTGNALLARYRACGRFAAGLTDLGDPALVAAPLAYNKTDVRGWGRRRSDGTWGWAWSQAQTQALSRAKATMTIGGLSGGTFRVDWVSTETGAVLSTAQVATTPVSVGGIASTGLVLTMPLIQAKDVAVRFTSDAAAILPFAVAQVSSVREAGSGETSATVVVAAGPAAGSHGRGRHCGMGGGLALVALALTAGAMRLRRRA